MDFTSEFYHTATVAWACGIISVLCAVEAWRQRQFRWQLVGGILAGLSGVMCPATLTRGYYEMVLVNQQLAAVVAAKKAEGVSDGERVQLVRADVVESSAGRRYERVEFVSRGTGGQMPDLRGFAGRIDGSIRQIESKNRLEFGSVVRLPEISSNSRF